MSRRRKSSDTTPFDTLRLEGTLFVPELLERAARGEATAQKDIDYAIPKGLKLHDEYGRAYRIASALWQDFARQLPRTDIDPAAITRSFVLDFLRQCLGYTDLTPLTAPVTLNDRSFSITAQALGGRIPVIIASHRLGLDDPDPCFAVQGAGARKKSAHQLAQEFLNADRNTLWALVTNGKTLRILRDAETLTRPNFLEFDLETILREGEDRYAEFSALWRILHASRAGTATALPADCIWEKWKTEGHAQGLRVRDGLRDGVTQALLILGTGFLKHPENKALRLRLHEGTLTKEDYFQQLLRLIYRCLFLFCAEERDLLHTPTPADSTSAAAHAAARNAYAEGYAMRRFRNRCLRQSAHDRYEDLWQSIRIVFDALANGQPRLALPALGSLFGKAQCPEIDGAALSNRYLLDAMRQLRWSSVSGSLSAIDYRNMGPEELGSVYESLLELVPQLDLPARTFGFVGITDSGSTSGNARKTTGSYYTPDSLVQELIKSALDPVIADRLAANPERPIDALLGITVCDPSCGSGHFLLAAARRLAEKLAELRSPDGAVRPDDYRHALREVASRCIYGVDINPMAVELCRVALWLETVDPGKPLSFLDHHIRCGNSLLGATPELIAAGLPDDTFTAIEGDDKAACSELKKRNRLERDGFKYLFHNEEQSIRDRLRQAATTLDGMDDSQADLLQQKEAAFATSETAPDHRHAKLLADIWCAAFVIKKRYPECEITAVAMAAPDFDASLPEPPPSLEGHLFNLDDELLGQGRPQTALKRKAKAKTNQPKAVNPQQGTAQGITTQYLRDFVQGQPLPAYLQSEVDALASQYRFFHWHLAFPQIFDRGGFDCILGNPPWERVNLEARQFFATRRPDIADAITSKRRNLIAELEATAPDAFKEFASAQRTAAAEIAFFKNSGRYPHLNQARLNTYVLFTEIAALICNKIGRVGIIVPSGVATDEISRALFSFLMKEHRIVSLFDFENREGLFPAIDSRIKFCLLSLTGNALHSPAAFAFFLHDPAQLGDHTRIWNLSARDLDLLSPVSGLCPTFRNSSDRELVLRILRCVLPFISQQNTKADWTKSDYLIMFRSDDSTHLYRTTQQLGVAEPEAQSMPCLDANGVIYLPVWESKMVHQFDHRFGTFAAVSSEDRAAGNAANVESKDKPNHWSAIPRHWVPERSVDDVFASRNWKRNWSLGYRDICRSTDERTSIATVLPLGGAAQPLNLFLPESPTHACVWVAAMNSFAFDFIARQRVGGIHLNITTCRQLPMVSPKALSDQEKQFIFTHTLELLYTTPALEAFATDCGWGCPPFQWDEERRFLLRCELDAAFFHLYLGTEAEWRQQSTTLTNAFPTPRDAVSYIMETFPIVKRKDEAKHGSFRTKETILEIYDALAEAQQPGAAPFVSSLTPPPADILVTHDPRLPASLRPSFSSADYFEYIVPLIARLRPKGVEVDRFVIALEILSESGPRRTALKGLDGVWSQWATSFPRNYAFSDAAAALLVLLQDNTLTRWQGRISAPPGVTFVENEWLNVDAFIALRLALAAPTATIQQRRTEIVQRFPALALLLTAA